MAHRQRLPLLAAIIVAAFSVPVPVPSAQTREVMTPVPRETALAAMPQGVPDAACVAGCGAERDRAIAEADKQLAGRKYFSGFTSNCWSLENAPNCAAVRQTCRDACNYDDSCYAACSASFQACCYANDKTRAQRYYDICIVRCPASKAPAAPPPPPPPPSGDQSKGALIDRKSEWTSLIRVANSLLDMVGLDKLDPDQFNDMRRTLAFLQVRASMAVYGSKYAVVSGGAGRIWLLTTDGKQVLLNAKQSEMVRGPAQGEWQGAEYQNTLTTLTTLAGLSPDEAKDCINQVRLANQRQKFGAGETLEFPPWQGWPAGARASSEHSSVRGTINGGGDFI
jgi:hypothetical protein